MAWWAEPGTPSAPPPSSGGPTVLTDAAVTLAWPCRCLGSASQRGRRPEPGQAGAPGIP